MLVKNGCNFNQLLYWLIVGCGSSLRFLETPDTEWCVIASSFLWASSKGSLERLDTGQEIWKSSFFLHGMVGGKMTPQRCLYSKPETLRGVRTSEMWSRVCGWIISVTLINEPLNVESLSELERGKKGEERRKRSQNPWITNGSGELEIARILILPCGLQKAVQPCWQLDF